MTMKELITMSMNEIQDYMLTMNFKKKLVGGVDEDSVLEHVKAICGVAREEMEKQFEAYENSVRKKQDELDRYRSELEKYRSTNQQLQEERDQLKIRVENMQAEAGQYKEAREHVEQEEKNYRDARPELMEALDAIQRVKGEVEKAVREELRESLRVEEEAERKHMLERIEGESVIAKQRLKHLNEEIAAIEKKRQSMEENLYHKREQWKKHLAFVSGLFGGDAEKDGPPTH